MRTYPCNLAPSKMCRYGGNKAYRHCAGTGTAEYCRLKRQWVANLAKCPKENAELSLDSRAD